MLPASVHPLLHRCSIAPTRPTAQCPYSLPLLTPPPHPPILCTFLLHPPIPLFPIVRLSFFATHHPFHSILLPVTLLPSHSHLPTSFHTIRKPLLMGVWQGVSMYSLNFYPGPPCLTLLGLAGGPPLKRPYSHFRAGPPTGWVACGRLLAFWTPHAVRLCPCFPHPLRRRISDGINKIQKEKCKGPGRISWGFQRV
jgi:hypothetical protein